MHIILYERFKSLTKKTSSTRYYVNKTFSLLLLLIVLMLNCSEHYNENSSAFNAKSINDEFELTSSSFLLGPIEMVNEDYFDLLYSNKSSSVESYQRFKLLREVLYKKIYEDASNTAAEELSEIEMYLKVGLDNSYINPNSYKPQQIISNTDIESYTKIIAICEMRKYVAKDIIVLDFYRSIQK